MSKIDVLRNLKSLIDKASTRIYDLAIKTELSYANNFSKKLRNNIYFKREDHQPVFSFKLRGAYNKMLELNSIIGKDQEVYACSAGNHAQGVALSGSHLNIPTNIIMPTFTPEIKIDNVKNFGGNVILHGSSFDEAKNECNRIVDQNNGIIVHPFDDLDIIAGQGTIGKELIDQLENIDYVFSPIGGGGILAGVCGYIKETNPSIKVIGVETFDSNSMYLSKIKGELKDLLRARLNSSERPEFAPIIQSLTTRVLEKTHKKSPFAEMLNSLSVITGESDPVFDLIIDDEIIYKKSKTQIEPLKVPITVSISNLVLETVEVNLSKDDDVFFEENGMSPTTRATLTNEHIYTSQEFMKTIKLGNSWDSSSKKKEKTFQIALRGKGLVDQKIYTKEAHCTVRIKDRATDPVREITDETINDIYPGTSGTVLKNIFFGLIYKINF